MHAYHNRLLDVRRAARPAYQVHVPGGLLRVRELFKALRQYVIERAHHLVRRRDGYVHRR